jgi:hypothetical protein
MKIENILKRAITLWLLFFVYTVSVAQNSDKVYKIVYDMPEFSGE